MGSATKSKAKMLLVELEKVHDSIDFINKNINPILVEMGGILNKYFVKRDKYSFVFSGKEYFDPFTNEDYEKMKSFVKSFQTKLKELVIKLPLFRELATSSSINYSELINSTNDEKYLKLIEMLKEIENSIKRHDKNQFQEILMKADSLKNVIFDGKTPFSDYARQEYGAKDIAFLKTEHAKYLDAFKTALETLNAIEGLINNRH